jgi:hypothetical protein
MPVLFLSPSIIPLLENDVTNISGCLVNNLVSHNLRNMLLVFSVFSAFREPNYRSEM